MADYNMSCIYCGEILPEKLIQLSHDVPKYVGGTDKDGRHYLCPKCHDIYERMCFAAMVKNLPDEIKTQMRAEAKRFALRFFK